MKFILTENQISSLMKEKSNFDKIMDDYIIKFPEELKITGEIIKKLIKNYISKTGYKLKFLNSCSTGFAGVRTKDQVIICRPTGTMGDFIYTIFHEIRHDNQIKEIKMKNPLTDFDLEDFEKLYEQYWEMELDADQFAKNMVAKLVLKSKLPIDFAADKLKLSPYIEKYPTMSKMVKFSLESIIREIKQMKSSGQKFEDIQDIPLVKKQIEKLEDFI